MMAAGESMALSEAAESVNGFLESYRSAFERLDAPAIADHFAYPSHILASTELSPRLVQATVHWALHDRVGGILYRFQATYNEVES